MEPEGWTREPAPAERTKVPSAVVIREPSPGLVGNPCPTPVRTVAPAAVPVRAPTGAGIIRHPTVAVDADVNPLAIAIKVAHTHVNVVRDVLRAHVRHLVVRPAVSPLV